MIAQDSPRVSRREGGALLVGGLLVLLLAFVPTVPLLIGLGTLLVVALPLINPVFGLYWALLSVPVQELVQLPGGLSLTQAAMLLAVGGWALRVLTHPERATVKGRMFLPWIGLLWALLLSASMTAYSHSEALKELFRWGEAFLIWWIALNTLRERWQIIGLLAALLLGPLAEAIYGLLQFVTGDGPPSFRISAGQPFVRAYGTIGQPNSFAGYLNMAWPLALALAIGAAWALFQRRRGLNPDRAGSSRGERWGLALVLWLVTATLLAALAASFSRGGRVLAAIGLLGMALVTGRWATRAALAALVLVGLGLGLAGAGALPEPIARRVSSITRNLAFFDPATVQITRENFAVVERMSQIQAGWHMFLAHPLTGVGPGNYTSAYPDFAIPPWYISRGHAHNYYLHIAAEAGVIGLLAYLVLLIGVSYTAKANLHRANGTFWRSVLVGCCGIIAAVAGHHLFENLHVLSMGIQVAAVWALVEVAGTHILNDQPPAPPVQRDAGAN